jgi:hypothetical protein
LHKEGFSEKMQSIFKCMQGDLESLKRDFERFLKKQRGKDHKRAF